MQRDKIKEHLNIKELPWTDKQKKFIDAALDKNTKIIICNGRAGTGKTLVSLYCCLELLNKKQIGDIIFYRNPVESGGKGLGYLAGDYFDKVFPYGAPLHDHLKELLDKRTVDSLVQDGRVSVESIGFIKGRTHHVTGVICDEAEDLSVQLLELMMGRMGKFSKLFIIGDSRQSDVKNSGFSQTLELFKGEDSLKNGIVTFEFGSEDCMRSPILKFIIEKFESIKYK